MLTPPPERRTTVLVVDDSAMDRRLAGSLLKKRAGFVPIFAANGKEALELIDRDPPEVVVTDLQMDELDGLELVAAVRQRFPHLPVILMTAHGSEELAVEALHKGAASFVPKRSLAEKLVSTVEDVLQVAKRSKPQQGALEWLLHSESKFELTNDVQIIAPVVGHLESNLTRLKVADETLLIQVGVALREALVNAMHHGNLEVPSSLREGDGKAYDALVAERLQTMPYAGRRVRVTATETRTQVMYVIADEGPGFDPSSLPDPTDPLQLEMSSGRGLLLIRTFMDEVRHNASGNEITMIKRFDQPSLEG